MKKYITIFLSVMMLFCSSICYAAVSGNTSGGECDITIKNFNPRSTKTVSTTITVMDARGWKQSKGKIYVDVYDEVGVRMQHVMIQGSGKISLKTNHKFYVLKFSNACRGNDPNYYNSVKWRVDKTSL